MGDHTTCSICKSIPERSNEFAVGGELQGERLPYEASQLDVVGAPFFKDDTVSSRTILKRCSECGTFYEWDYEYEYLVGGSEDDITLTRLSDEEGQRRETEAFAIIEAAKLRYEEKAKAALEFLREADDPGEIDEALNVFSYAQLVQGFDISPAIPTLIHTLERLAGKTTYDREINSLKVMLNIFSEKSEQNAQKALEAIEKRKKISPELKQIREWCQQKSKK